MESQEARVKVGVIMGSKSDWTTMKEAMDILREWKIPAEARVVSAHRTPELLYSYSKSALDRGLEVIIAGAGGAAHLPGMVAAMTDLPVIGVPVQSQALKGMDSLLSIVQMPKGTPVATVSIGSAGAQNAAYLALKILGLKDRELQKRLTAHRLEKEQLVANESLEIG